MRRALLLASVATLALAATAGAHPLGNFTINHLSRVTVSADRVDVGYVIDQAEIPTFQERGRSPAVVLGRKRAEAHTYLRRALALNPRFSPLLGPRAERALSGLR